MNLYQPPETNVAGPKRTLGSVLIGIVCIGFGALIALSSVINFLGVIANQSAPRSSAEAAGGHVASVLVIFAAMYLILYGVKKIRRQSPEKSK